MKSHVDDLRQHLAALCQNTAATACKNLADACIRAHVYIQTDYPMDLAQR